MMPTTRAAILAVGLACAALTAPSDGAEAAQAAPHTTATAPAIAEAADAVSLPAKLGLAGSSVGALALYLRRRARRRADREVSR